MTLNFSSCSVYPTTLPSTATIRASADDEYASTARHRQRGVDGGCGGPYRAADRGGGGYGSSSCWSGWDVYGYHDYGRDADNDGGSYDPADLLPSDPFGMELSSTFTAALADWIENFGSSDEEYEDEGESFIADLSYYWSHALAADSSPGCEFPYDPWAETELLGLPFYDSLGVPEFKSCSESGAASSGGVESVPPEGLIYALGYLGVRDLLSVEMVCKSLHSAVKNDTLLWRCIHISHPLSTAITDADLLHLTQRSQGSLQCLNLVRCPRITDEGLKRVLEGNPKLQKLSVPGCSRLSIDGLMNILKSLKSTGYLRIKHLKLGQHFSISPEQYEELRILVGGGDIQQQPKVRKPQFYHDYRSSPSSCNDERAIDIELCPICQKFTMVFDCPSESCQGRGSDHCRACTTCIDRCTQCGKCIGNCTYVETFMMDNVCSMCWESAPSEK